MVVKEQKNNNGKGAHFIFNFVGMGKIVNFAVLNQRKISAAKIEKKTTFIHIKQWRSITHLDSCMV